jgi:hypothetical protein
MWLSVLQFDAGEHGASARRGRLRVTITPEAPLGKILTAADEGTWVPTFICGPFPAEKVPAATLKSLADRLEARTATDESRRDHIKTFLAGAGCPGAHFLINTPGRWTVDEEMDALDPAWRDLYQRILLQTARVGAGGGSGGDAIVL